MDMPPPLALDEAKGPNNVDNLIEGDSLHHLPTMKVV